MYKLYGGVVASQWRQKTKSSSCSNDFTFLIIIIDICFVLFCVWHNNFLFPSRNYIYLLCEDIVIEICAHKAMNCNEHFHMNILTLSIVIQIFLILYYCYRSEDFAMNWRLLWNILNFANWKLWNMDVICDHL